MTNEQRSAQMSEIVQEQYALALGKAIMEKIEAQAVAQVLNNELASIQQSSPVVDHAD